MNHPRPSILHLFDPLSSRDTIDSHKENALPSDFFLQTFVKHSSPVRLTTRLVEVGDTTVELGAADEEEEETDDEEEENLTVGLHPPSPRTPLVDVAFDRERTPMRFKMYKRNARPAAEDHALLSVNVLDTTPTIVLCPAEPSPSSSAEETDSASSSLVTLPLSTPTGSLIADTTLALPTPSQASTSLVSSAQCRAMAIDMNRSSADLQTSFALHTGANTSDASFDLLNDKISFLGLGDEESFDMGRGLGPISEDRSKELDSKVDILKCDSPAMSAEAAVQQPAEQLSSAAPPRSRSATPQRAGNREVIADTGLPPLHETSTLSQPLTKLSSAPVFVAPPAKPSPPMVSALSTTLPEPQSLVPALKIVKRKRPDTSSMPKPTAPPVAASTVIATAPSPVPPPPTNAATTAGRYVMEGPGPWRVPISSTVTGKEKVAGKSRKPTPAAVSSGPRRVLLPQAAAAPAPVASKAAAAPQFPEPKRPLRVVPPNGAVAASGLPRAASSNSGGGSRLPMPKSKIALPTGGGASGLPRRRVP